MEQVVFMPPATTSEEVATAIEPMLNEHRGRFSIAFRKPVEVYVNFTGKKRRQVVDVLSGVKFFRDARTRRLCYTTHSRRGFFLTDLPIEEILAIREEPVVTRDQKMQEKLRKIAAIQRRIHPNAWDNLKQDPPERFKHYGLAVSIKDKFPEHVIEYLKNSFETKTACRYTACGHESYFTVETSLGDDGIFRGWFTSGPIDEGRRRTINYLLINPTTAAFGEAD